MPRPINLRQIEIFKALIEHGTVSRAAEILYISQPAASKLLMQLEEDNGLKLFDRHKGRLTPTTQGFRLYEEIGRIFAGVRQVENALDFIKREDRGRLVAGAIPALVGAVMQRATMNFLERNPNVHFTIVSLSSQWIADRVLTRNLDVGIASSRIDNPYLVTESLMEYPLVCVMPLDHPLAKKQVVQPADLEDVPFLSFSSDSYTGQKVAAMFENFNLVPEIVLSAHSNNTIMEFVAAGLGVSVVHPLFVVGMEDRVVTRPFRPALLMDFLFCYARDARNADLIAKFVNETKAMAADFTEKLERSWPEQ